MQLTFLESANKTRLSKELKKATGFIPYPHVKKLNSHEHTISLDDFGLTTFENLIRDHGEKGHCLLKGELKQRLNNESRTGKTNRVAYSSLLVLDIDGITLPGYIAPNKFTSQDIKNLAETILRELPAEIQQCSYIAQASASLGLKANRISMHLFFMLTYPMPPKSIKLWLQHCNFESELFSSQLELSANGHSLKYPLDISVADNSKLIFIAPPTFEDPKDDPFAKADDRIILVSNKNKSVDLAALMGDISPENIHQTNTKHKNQLRKDHGFSAKTEKVTTATVGNRSEFILENPDRMSISILSNQYKPFITCNVNGGDSGAYYFNLKDATYMYNFKGEPIWSIEKADPDFYKSIFEIYEQEMQEDGQAKYPVVLRDFQTDIYYNGVFDPNLNQFDDEFPLTPCSASSIEGFMRSHGRTRPDFVPDASVTFDPTSTEDAINLTTIPYSINMYRKTKFMRLPSNGEKLEFTLGDSKKIGEHCPLIHKLLTHILGGQNLEVEHFTNWLAYIFQTKKKAKTAWVLQGVPGTGKGIFYTEVLRPLFGNAHVPMRALQNIEEQFNLYMRQALFLVVDEFHMGSANAGTMKIADKLKNAITESTQTIRAMRSNQAEVPNFTNFIFLTNRADAVKIEEGDRRYNIAPRQEQKLENVYPEVIEGIDDIAGELNSFARILDSWKVNKQLVRTPIANNAKAHMAQVTMSVMEEFFAAVKAGNTKFFLDILDINLTNVMQGQEITTAQRFVKKWIAETQAPYSIIPMEHLRTVYTVLTEDRLSQREFQKRAERFGMKKERKREHGALRSTAPLRGVITHWKLETDELSEITEKYFDDKDLKLLAVNG
ncbi:MAG: hypothetical protein CL885_04125 [Dehalococcoidia bacterium]|nr:hypothetical protein [Dehalococcoidia bacterium]